MTEDTVTSSCTMRIHLRKTALCESTEAALAEMNQRVRNIQKCVQVDAAANDVIAEVLLDYLTAYFAVPEKGCGQL
jgi:hypothetical protein